ncbi:MAG: urease accessory protein UreE [Magnetospiraceae bacterium]
MQRAIAHFGKGHWPMDAAIAQVTLAFEDRHRRRIRLRPDDGEDFLLDLPKPVLLADGDGLELEQGGYIAVRAKVESVAEFTGTDPAHAARLAWHVGNRHTALQVLDDGRLRILYDHVLVDMLEGLGAMVTEIHAPFAPEPGAYSGGGLHGGHAHD